MDTLLIVDVQNDFLPGGALEVPEGDQVIPVINELQKKFRTIVASRDWHPADHGSFASNHPGHKPGDIITLNGLEQILWPDHCVQGTRGAEFAPELNQEPIQKVIFKGTDPGVDSYSAFYDNGHRIETELHNYLQEKGTKTLYITGLAADVCVYFTVKDALLLGYETYLITDATRGVNLNPGDTQNAMTDMKKHGAKLIESSTII
ncbi:MAG: bifunctional nicotinamidase/pyrazinamidase [Bacteroidota bacterium]